MLHHVSFSVHDPARAASLAAKLLGGYAIVGPSPPFPPGTWFAVVGDDAGSLIELTPWGSVLDPQVGVSQDAAMRSRTASHVLAGTPLSATHATSIAEAAGARVSAVDAGLFRFLKIWIEDSFLLELLTPDQRPDYVACFGSAGLAHLDDRLRGLERAIASAMPPASNAPG